MPASEAADVDRSEVGIRDELGHRLLRGLVISSEQDRDPLVAGTRGELVDLACAYRVERLDHPYIPERALLVLRCGQPAGEVQELDPPVPDGDRVAGVDHTPSSQRLPGVPGDPRVPVERNGDDHDVGNCCGLGNAGAAGVGSGQLGGVRQLLGVPAPAEDHLVSGAGD
jgi:hypothetical protein